MEVVTELEKLKSVSDVAKLTNKNKQTIHRWIKSGKLPAVKLGHFYFINEDVMDKASGLSVTASQITS